MLRKLLSSLFRSAGRPAAAVARVSIQDFLSRVEQGRRDEARALLEQGWQASQAGYWELRGYLESRLGSFEDAAACFARGLQIDPGSTGLRSNLAAALQALDRLDESELEYDRLLAQAPDPVGLLLGAGFVKRRLLKYTEAEALFRRALALSPQDSGAHRDLGDLLARQGRYLEAWPHWQRNPGISGAAAQARPGTLWLGEPADIGRLRIWCGMGLGDYLQFLRFVPLLKSRHPGLQVELEVPPELVRLAARLKGVDRIVDASKPDGQPAPDHHVSVMSLPLILGEAGLPPWRGAYLAEGVRPPMKNAVPRSGLRIGLVWAGGYDPAAPADLNRFQGKRDVPLPLLMQCFPEPGVELVVLQKGRGLSQLEALDEAQKKRLSLPQIRDFLDTARLLDAVDVLVTVETSVAHLGGALGVPTLLLCVADLYCAWRGGQVRSEWYPSLRVLTQQRPGDWSQPLAQLAQTLKGGLAGGGFGVERQAPMP